MSSDNPLGAILVVEDDQDLRDVICHCLGDAGHDVVGVAGGTEALAYLSSAPPPRLILLDAMMPTMSGWQFLAKRRSDQRLSQIRVIMMTASRQLDGDLTDVERVIYKPLDLETLLTLANANA